MSFQIGCYVLEHAINSEPNDNKRTSEKSVQPFTKRDVSLLEIKILIFYSSFLGPVVQSEIKLTNP